MRRALTGAMIGMGLILMLIGYFGAAPWGADTVASSDPRFVFAPALFVVGVIVAFSAALVYELFSDRQER